MAINEVVDWAQRCRDIIGILVPTSAGQLFNAQKTDDKIFICTFSNNVRSKLYHHIENSKTRGQTDEVAHDEPPHQDLRCLQIQQFSSLLVKEVK